jgi:hypothetical protein
MFSLSKYWSIFPNKLEILRFLPYYAAFEHNPTSLDHYSVLPFYRFGFARER